MARTGPALTIRALVATVVAGTLLLPASADARYAYRTLRKGSHGGDVKQLQRYLTRTGFHAVADGYFGRRTRAAQRRFERHTDRRPNGRASRREQRAVRGLARRERSRGSGAAAAPVEGNPSDRTVISADGRTAIAPDSAPQEVSDAVAAANRITRKPYRYGGGHGRWEDSGYDCSGAVSYALHGAGLLDHSLASSGFMRWGAKGRGRWITVYANEGHAYVVIGGLRFDTSSAGAGGGSGPRWRTTGRSARGYVARHPAGF